MSGRPARANRGSRLQELLQISKDGQDLPEDDFYSSLADLSSDDNEFDENESSASSSDSDIDDPEDVVNEAEEAQKAEEQAVSADKEKGRKKNVYVDPAKMKTKTKTKSETTQKTSTDQTSSSDQSELKTPKSPIAEKKPSSPRSVRKSTRRLSVKKAEEREKKQKETDKRKKERVQKPKSQAKVYTQEELLQEALITEERNKASLQVMLQLEEQSKRDRQTKKPALTGPRAIFTSTKLGDIVTFTQGLPSFFSTPVAPVVVAAPTLLEKRKAPEPITKSDSHNTRDAKITVRSPTKRKKPARYVSDSESFETESD